MTVLLGRVEERARLDDLLAGAREGRSGVVLIRGAPGIGKTALLEYAVGQASGFEVVRAAGVESEMELAFAALQQLCSPFLSRLDRLPGPQRVGLETAFGLSAGNPPDPLFVGLGVLSLLSDAASAERPLLCVVDDVQWLDRASALALGVVARRLEADRVALVLAARDLVELKELSGLAGLYLDGLSGTDSRQLLSSVLPGRVDERVVERILAETGGNPLALIELPRGMSAADLSGGFGLLERLGVSGRIEESFRRRLEPLPADTRRLLLVAAAEESGDAALLWRACARLGVSPDAAGAAEDENLIRIDSSVRFFHPLVRSAVYQSASANERRQAHGALAEAIDPMRDPDRHAWHWAEATSGPDEEVAAELERSAQRAQARGGVAAAAAFLERSVALTLEAGSRSVRALAAAEASNQAGGYERALELLAIAEGGPLDEVQRAQTVRLRGLIIYARSGRRDGARDLLRAAQALAALDEGLSRTTFMEALQAAQGSASQDVWAEVGRALLELPESEPPDPTVLLLRGYGASLVHGFPHGLDLLRQAVDAFRTAPLSGDEHPYALSLAARAANTLADDAGWDHLSARNLRLARDAGAVGHWLPEALDNRAGFLASAGELAEAIATLDEADAVKAAIGVGSGWMGGFRAKGLREGGTGLCESLKRQLREDFDMTKPSVLASLIEATLAMLYNGLGLYRDAFEAGVRSRRRHPAGGTGAGLPELVEAAARCDETEVALSALEALSARTQLGGSNWALGVEACSRALISQDANADGLYQEAIEHLALTRMRLPLARAHLLYGEWLRRENRRVEARQQLHTAHDMFDDMGATSFAARARYELTATGVTTHSRRDATLDLLTPQEERIANLAGQGLSNAQIASQLYISRNTVDYHLRKVFRKLDVRSRSQLIHRIHPALAQN
jgi:DNA-binding CsgD family transcriptional regulator/tetratricopeptide (TPR) repeat protein